MKHIETQTDKILKHLKKGKTLTSLEALEKFQCFRLASRISDLKKEGHVISSVMIKTKHSDKSVACYSLVKAA